MKIYSRLKKFTLLNKKLSAFSLVEVLLSVTLFTLFVLGLSGGLAYSMQSSEVTSYKARAVFLADEGLEAVRSIRNSSYDSLVVGTHGLSSSGPTWALNGTSDNIAEFTRSIEITNIDSTTKQIVSRVSWPAAVGVANTISTSAYLTNWLREISQVWTNPTLGNVLDISGNQDLTAISYSNNHVYAVRSTGSSNLITIDISGTAPSITNSINSSASFNSVSVSPAGSFLATTSTSNSSELVLYSLANTAVPSQIFTYNAAGNANGLASYIHTNNYLYLARASSNDAELLILDVTTPENATLVGTAQYGSSLNDIVVIGDYAYAATSNTSQELVVFDISNPASATVVGSYNAEGNSQGTSIAIFGTTLIFGNTDGSVFIMNISNPSSPTNISTYYTGSNSRVNEISLNSDNTLIFIASANTSKAFTVVNISDIVSPSELSFVDVSGSLTGLVYDVVRDKVYGVGSNNSSEFVIINSN